MLDEHFLIHKKPALEYFTDRIIFAHSSEASTCQKNLHLGRGAQA